MTLWKTLVVALVAAFALAACNGSSDSGPSQADLDAANERADAAEERAEDAEQAQQEAENERDQAETDRDSAERERDALEDQMALEEERKAAGMARGVFSALDRSLMTVEGVTVDGGSLVNADLTPVTTPATTQIEDVGFTDAQTMTLGAMNGWKGQEYQKKSYTARLYNNLGPGTRVDFASQYGATVLSSDSDFDANLVGGSVFAPAGAGSTNHANNRDSDDAGSEPDFFSTSGTYAGAQGTWVCIPTAAGTPCSSTVSGEGFALSAGVWTFTPAGGATALRADTDYGYFGWWLHEDAEGDYHVGVMSDIVENTGVTVDISGLDGTATYSGLAAGKFASYDPSIQGGHFTADVELKAKFGGSEAHTISGMIGNFVGPNESAAWSVELPELTIATTGTIAAGTAAEQLPVWSIGDDDAAPAGSWSGEVGNESPGGVPLTAVGTFTAEHGHIGRMAGGFGATRSGP